MAHKGEKRQFFEACEKGKLSIVTTGVENQKWLNEPRPSDGMTPIMIAAYHGHTDLVAYLMRKGADLSIKDASGRTVFDYAKDKKITALLRGKVVKTLDEQLIDAIKRGDMALARNLISQGASVNAVDENGKTALMLAAEKGDADAIRTLIASGADLNAQNAAGETALMAAITVGSMASVQALIENGADLTIRDNQGRTAMHHVSAHMTNEQDVAAVYNAAVRQGYSVADLASVQDNDGNNAGHVAALFGSAAGVMVPLRLMKDNVGAQVQFMSDENSSGHTVLEAGVSNESLSVEERQHYSNSVVKCACEQHPAVINALVNRFVDSNHLSDETQNMQLNSLQQNPKANDALVCSAYGAFCGYRKTYDRQEDGSYQEKYTVCEPETNPRRIALWSKVIESATDAQNQYAAEDYVRVSKLLSPERQAIVQQLRQRNPKFDEAIRKVEKAGKIKPLEEITREEIKELAPRRVQQYLNVSSEITLEAAAKDYLDKKDTFSKEKAEKAAQLIAETPRFREAIEREQANRNAHQGTVSDRLSQCADCVTTEQETEKPREPFLRPQSQPDNRPLSELMGRNSGK